MKLLLDMNLSPAWSPILSLLGHEVRHWSRIGDPKATDREIMQWALENGYVVLTHDLDFSAMLAATNAIGPSVLQIRTQDTLPAHLEPLLARSLCTYATHLASGALVVVDEKRMRARVLPLNE